MFYGVSQCFTSVSWCLVSLATIGDRAAADRVRDRDNTKGIGDNTAGIGDNAAGIGDNSTEIGMTPEGLSVLPRK